MKKREVGYVMLISEPAKSRIQNNQCPSCGLPKEQWKRRKDWRCCSAECTNKFERSIVIRDWPELRRRCFERDKFTCVKCGKNKETTLSKNLHNYLYDYYKKQNSIIRENETEFIVGNQDGFIADHIEAIALGGEQWDINNLQTLCIKCNKIKTKKDMAKIATLRRQEKADEITKQHNIELIK